MKVFTSEFLTKNTNSDLLRLYICERGCYGKIKVYGYILGLWIYFWITYITDAYTYV